MIKQSNLFGEILELPLPHQLRKVCCEVCYNAREKICVCKCHGAFHGLGAVNKRKGQTTESNPNPYIKNLGIESEQCGSCLLLTLPIRGLQKYPECLKHLSVETCGGPFLPTKERLATFGKAMKNVMESLNQDLKKERDLLRERRLSYLRGEEERCVKDHREQEARDCRREINWIEDENLAEGKAKKQ